MTITNLTSKNVFAYAMHIYSNPSCTGVDEFNDDFVRIKYAKRLLLRYIRTQGVPVRLLLNHLIGLYNVFEPVGLTRVLFLSIDPSGWSALKTVLEFLSFMPDEIPAVNGTPIINADIPRDDTLWQLIQEAINVHSKSR